MKKDSTNWTHSSSKRGGARPGAGQPKGTKMKNRKPLPETKVISCRVSLECLSNIEKMAKDYGKKKGRIASEALEAFFLRI